MPKSRLLGVVLAVALAVGKVSLVSAQETDSTGSALSAALTLRDVIDVTLAQSAAVARARWSVVAQQASLTQVAARFDPTLSLSVQRTQTRTPLFGTQPTDPSTSLAASLGYELAIDWLLPLGVTISPTTSFARADVSASGDIRNTGTAGVGVDVPLLRGRGGGAARATYRAAQAVLEASQADAARSTYATVLDAVGAYWSYVAAREALTALRQAEQRAQTLVEQTRTLIAADERPAVDSLAVLAHAAGMSAARVSGENAVMTTRFNLATVIGLSPNQLPLLDRPTPRFPDLPDSSAMAAWPADDTLAAYALGHRPDVAAAQQRHEASQIIARGAASEARKRLDLHTGFAYTGIGLGGAAAQWLSPFTSQRSGLHVEVALLLDSPLGRSAASAARQQRVVEEEQAALSARDLERTIVLAVRSSAQTLRHRAEETRLSYQALLLSRAAVDGERQKYQLGTSTLFDVILAADNLTSAELGWINAQQRYEMAVAELLDKLGAPLGKVGCAQGLPGRIAAGDVCPR